MTDHPPASTSRRVLAVIPARLASQRLPRKVLRDIAGQPLLYWTVQAVLRCPQIQDVIVAVDSEEVAALCRQHGWAFQLTSPALPSGTDRLYAVAATIPADLYINVQADEPLITPEHIAALLKPFEHPAVDVTTLKIRCTATEIADSNAVKVVTALDGRALYFSRAPIPFARDGGMQTPHFRHLGLYAYRRPALERFAHLPPSPLEETERLEQLRLLENGLTLYVEEVSTPTLGVDTEADLAAVASVLAHRTTPETR